MPTQAPTTTPPPPPQTTTTKTVRGRATIPSFCFTLQLLISTREGKQTRQVSAVLDWSIGDSNYLKLLQILYYLVSIYYLLYSNLFGNFGPINGQTWPKNVFFAKYWHFWPILSHAQKTMQTTCPGGFSVIWVPKLLLSPVKIRSFCQKRPNFAGNWHFWSFWARPWRLIWCPVSGLVSGCGAQAVSRKTPFYFIMATLPSKVAGTTF